MSSKAAGHDDDHGPLDHRGVVVGETFVVADGAAAAVDPGEGPLDGPSAVQHDEGGLPGQFGDDLDGEPEVGGGPVDEFAGVAAVGPEQTDAREADAQRPEQGPGGVAVLDVRAGDQDGQQQAAGVDHDVAFTAIDLLPGVVAAAGPAHGVGAAHGLRVDQGGRRLAVAAFDLFADLFAQAVVHA